MNTPEELHFSEGNQWDQVEESVIKGKYPDCGGLGGDLIDKLRTLKIRQEQLRKILGKKYTVPPASN